MDKIGFDNERYLKTQSEHIKERIAKFGGKLYLEFGGKLFDDYHASRVLPGFHPDSKIRMLGELKDDAEIVIAIHAGDIEKNKVRGDLGITYDMDVLRLIDAFRGYGLYVGSVVLTRFSGQESAIAYQQKLESLGIKVYRHYSIPSYPSNVPLIISDEGFGKNEYIETSRSLIVVTAPGPGSGKMAVCLSQLYQDHKHGINAGYAKFETFPIWNIPLQHPVNLAYEAATADLNDINMIDPYHLEAYGVSTVNYNRDVEVFPVLRAMFNKIYGASPYQSPTDMGVNMVGNCIIDEDAVCKASQQEIIRRYYAALVERRKGSISSDIVEKEELLMEKANISIADRPVVAAAKQKAEISNGPAAAISLPDGSIVTGKTTALLGACAALLLNALKKCAGLPDDLKVISPEIIEPIQHLKLEHLGNHNPRLHTDEILIALTISANTDENAEKCMEQLSQLNQCEMHSTVILSQVDEKTLGKLGIRLSCEPQYQNKKLFHS
jgi:ATP-dependent Zn protease